jgi:NAD(P)-dependent dehydrogenase (short-subunit alcohol dehydrogenase family)
LTGSRLFSIHFIPLDVTSYASQCAFFRSARKLSPTNTITTIIANAGVAELGSFIESIPGAIPLNVDPPEPDLTTVDVNFKGVLYTTKLALHHLRSSPVGQRELILVGSMSSFTSGPMMAVYSATKHGVLGLFRSIRLFPSKRDGVRINLICPYFVDTPIVPLGGKLMLAGLEIAELDDVVDAAARLVCDEAIAGRCLAIAPRHAGGVMEVGVHDMESVDEFTRRVVKAMNMKNRTDILMKFLTDLMWLLVVGPILRLFRE